MTIYLSDPRYAGLEQLGNAIGQRLGKKQQEKREARDREKALGVFENIAKTLLPDHTAYLNQAAGNITGDARDILAGNQSEWQKTQQEIDLLNQQLPSITDPTQRTTFDSKIETLKNRQNQVHAKSEFIRGMLQSKGADLTGLEANDDIAATLKSNRGFYNGLMRQDGQQNTDSNLNNGFAFKTLNPKAPIDRSEFSLLPDAAVNVMQQSDSQYQVNNSDLSKNMDIVNKAKSLALANHEFNPAMEQIKFYKEMVKAGIPSGTVNSLMPMAGAVVNQAAKTIDKQKMQQAIDENMPLLFNATNKKDAVAALYKMKAAGAEVDYNLAKAALDADDRELTWKDTGDSIHLYSVRKDGRGEPQLVSEIPKSVPPATKYTADNSTRRSGKSSDQYMFKGHDIRQVQRAYNDASRMIKVDSGKTDALGKPIVESRIKDSKRAQQLQSILDEYYQLGAKDTPRQASSQSGDFGQSLRAEIDQEIQNGRTREQIEAAILSKANELEANGIDPGELIASIDWPDTAKNAKPTAVSPVLPSNGYLGTD